MAQTKDNRIGITFHLSQAELDEIDAHRAAAVAGVPGAKLHRASWVQQVVRRALDGLRQPQEESTPVPPPSRRRGRGDDVGTKAP